MAPLYKTNECAENRHGAQTLNERPSLGRHAAGDGPLRGILNCDSNGRSWPARAGGGRNAVHRLVPVPLETNTTGGFPANEIMNCALLSCRQLPTI